MPESVFNMLGSQLRAARTQRGLSQPALAARLGRNRARISELERDLANDRWGRDRLTLFAEICDALDLVPILTPRSRAAEIRVLVERAHQSAPRAHPARTAYDELFVDLGEDEGGDA